MKAARQLAKRAFRDRSRTFLAEGPQAVREALELPGTLLELFVTAAARDRHAGLVGQAAAQNIPVHAVSGEVMAELAQTVTPQGLLAVCRFLDVPLAGLVAARPRLVAVLASVRDPGNAGTVLRTADAAGAEGVIFTAASVDPYNSKCVRSSAGSLFHLPVVSGLSVAPTVDNLREAGLTVLATTLDGDPLDELDDVLSAPVAWLFGNEAHGLDADTAAAADRRVRVPIHGRAESLNLAAAAAVCLYTTVRAQRSR